MAYTNTIDRRTVLQTIGGAAGLALVGSATAKKGCDLVVNPDSNSPQHHDTIQGAVDDASAGDTICVKPGTYDEQVVIETADLTLRGSGNPKDIVVDGGSGVRETIDVNGASGVTIDGFTVENTGSSGGSLESYGVRVTGESDNFTFRDSVIRGINEVARATGLAVDAQPGPIPDKPASKATISGLEVHNCRIENIYATGDPGGDFSGTSRAKGIACNGDVPGAKITQTTVTNIGGSNTTFGRGISFTEDGADPPVGASDFEIRLCEFDGMEGTHTLGSGQPNPFAGAAMFVGEYPDFGNHVVEDNNILEPVENFPDGVPPQSGNDELDAPNNYWDASDGPNVAGGGGGSGSFVTKNVDFTPFRGKSVNNAGSNV